MYLLYLDDAGAVGDASQKYFVLAGIALFERHVYFLESALESLAAEILRSSADAATAYDSKELEFHGSHMLPGKRFWRSIRGASDRRALLIKALGSTRALQGRWCLFGAVVDKTQVSPQDASEYAFEQICSRFDQFLRRLHLDGNTQRGLVILDKSTQETRIQQLATEFRRTGHRWGQLRNIVDVPFFVASEATRAVQYADLVAYSLFRKYERGDGELADEIIDRFDTEGGVRHGLFVSGERSKS